MNAKLIILLATYWCCSYATAQNDYVVTTKKGQVKGYLSQDTKSVTYTLRYATAERWVDPIPVSSWDGILDVPDPPICPQACPKKSASSYYDCENKTQSEDCLYLNIFTPAVEPKDLKNLKRPVLVFIHGGAFVFGEGRYPLYDGSYHASHSGIIVVTLNYRLGALGFLVYGDDIKGNFGIKDQQLALKYVKENIADFGGDPDHITVSGESAGAMSVAVHATNEETRKLFEKIIIESDPFGVNYNTIELEKKNHAKDFVSKFTYTSPYECWGKEDKLSCLKNLKFENILKRQGVGFLELVFGGIYYSFQERVLLPWTPVIDGVELKRQPMNYFHENGSVIEKPALIGINTDEGVIFSNLVSWHILNGYILSRYSYKKLLTILFEKPIDKSQLVSFKDIYERPRYKLTSIFDNHRPQLSNVFTDYLFICPTLWASKSVADYSYEFNHPFPLGPLVVNDCKDKSCHGAELPYVFHTLDKLENISNIDDADRKVAALTSKYWANFVKTGNPNTDDNEMDQSCQAGSNSCGVSWPKFTENDQKSLEIKPNPEVVADIRSENNCDLWDEVGYGHITDKLIPLVDDLKDLMELVYHR